MKIPTDAENAQRAADLKVIENMRRFGGGFVQNLAEAWIRADQNNFDRLLAAFPEYWNEYAKGVEGASVAVEKGGAA